MPSKNDDVKVDRILPENFNPQTQPTNILTKPLSTPESTSLQKDEDFGHLLYDEPSDDDMPWYEERYFASEERYFTKMNQKFVARGFKRPPDTIRAETRRKYKNCREAKREEKRAQERFEQLFIPNPKDETPGWTTSPVPQSSFSRPKVESCTTTTTTTTQTTTTSTSQETKPAPAPTRYLSVNQEREYQDALRQSTSSVLPTAGISVQQMLEMLNRELTPEDYELLLRLDETVEKKTVNQETLTTLKEKTIDSEEHLSEVCTVCMFNYEMGDSVKYLPCNHLFHVDCIVPYLSSYGQSCPVCKAKVT
jgi:hypothetical protein